MYIVFDAETVSTPTKHSILNTYLSIDLTYLSNQVNPSVSNESMEGQVGERTSEKDGNGRTRPWGGTKRKEGSKSYTDSSGSK